MENKFVKFWKNIKNYLTWIIGLIGFVILFIFFIVGIKKEKPEKPEKPINDNQNSIHTGGTSKPDPPYTDHKTDKKNQNKIDEVRTKR